MGRTDHSHVQNLNVAIVAAMGDEAYERLERACGDLDAPFALVDLDALESNAADMERRAAGKPIRLASKSVRCRELQRRTLARAGFSGTLAFTLPEALWLARKEIALRNGRCDSPRTRPGPLVPPLPRVQHARDSAGFGAGA